MLPALRRQVKVWCKSNFEICLEGNFNQSLVGDDLYLKVKWEIWIGIMLYFSELKFGIIYFKFGIIYFKFGAFYFKFGAIYFKFGAFLFQIRYLLF